MWTLSWVLAGEVTPDVVIARQYFFSEPVTNECHCSQYFNSTPSDKQMTKSYFLWMVNIWQEGIWLRFGEKYCTWKVLKYMLNNCSDLMHLMQYKLTNQWLNVTCYIALLWCFKQLEIFHLGLNCRIFHNLLSTCYYQEEAITKECN